MEEYRHIMIVKYSHLKLDEIDRIRRESTLDVLGTMKEQTILVLRTFPLLLIDGLLIFFLLR